jgi:DNA-binding CsgD family transcriptional regulator
MPDGQIISRTHFPTPHFKAKSGSVRKAVPLSVAGYHVQNTRLLAQNAMLQSALDRQRMQSADLRSILSSMDMATLCVCPALKLRLFTAAAGHLLGIGPEDVGQPLVLSGPFGLDGTLMARIKAVLASGVAERHILTAASGQPLMCRLLPLRAGGAAEAVDGVILTFGDAPGDMADESAPHADGKPAAGIPDLASGLTRRQREVLGQVLAGHPSKNIAADLGISRRTVENHRAAIMARTGATSLPALARLAIGADVGGDCKQTPARRVCD